MFTLSTIVCWVRLGCSAATPGDSRGACPAARFHEQSIGLGIAPARALSDRHRRALLAAQRQRRPPFAIAAVEQQQWRAVGLAHDMAQIVRLPLAERRLDACRQVGLDE
jgi:hypothetical protein